MTKSEFIEIWNNAASSKEAIAEIARQTGQGKVAIQSLAKRYRREGETLRDWRSPLFGTEEFVEMWNNAATSHEAVSSIAAASGATESAILSRAARLKRSGVNLRKWQGLGQRITEAEFVDTWNNANSPADAIARLVKKTGLSTGTIRLHVKQYRQMGAPLKSFKLTAEEFAAIWNNAASSSAAVAEIKKQTGLTKATIQSRASRYRRAGIALKNWWWASTKTKE